ncbi:response regulator transcription factor [Pontibacillus sp. ALD_SL1]|uniref:response regulator transcription factor n=1 Tax=Pontibacillus sp. ALD_SL1 TaxID=2777185 RepID=UPI001F60FA04|nr:response regulator transcription factor [Pontibacillus sp. ALD_SL1]
MKEKVLVVEDEIPISRVLQAYLKKENYDTMVAFTGEEALKQFRQDEPHVVILDVMLPDRDGWSVLEEVRAESSCPVIMLTALGDVEYRLKGLNEGADDYIPKPFDANEVVARVRSILRRNPNVWTEEDVRRYGHLSLNFKSHRVVLHGARLSLTPRDTSVLFFLAQHPNHTFTREQLLDRVWGLDFDGSDRAVDLSIKRIRQALKNWPEEEGSIQTIRGLGYQFCVQAK